MNRDNQRCPTHFLPDDPASEDAFGSHKQVAEAILKLICDKASSPAHVIALEGSWGSGKSTVIRIFEHLAREKSNDAEIAVFLYDTWAYQGDSLRRSFLETLIDFLISREWIDKDSWAKEKELLARRREEATITTIPQFTSWGKVLAIVLGLVPVGMTLATMGGSINTYYRWIGVGFTLSPFLVAICAIIHRFWKKRFRKRKVAKQHNGSEQHSNEEQHSNDWIGLFIHKTREKQKTRTTRTPDPTAIEFVQKFKALLKEALQGNGHRRLVVVIDNLDRLPPDEALQAWATMRTFFDANPNETQDHPAQGRLYLIVPYAPEALSRIWDEDKHKYTTAQAFRDKTFQVRFNVSPPLLSDWSNFLKKQLEKALPKHKAKSEIDTIIRLFRLKGMPLERPLTPRDIILFVNQLAALHAQWEDEIPLSIQAAYLFYKEKIKIPMQDLIREDLLDMGVKVILQEKKWQKYFAALHFNVPVDRALQVLIEPEFDKALEEGNIDLLAPFINLPGAQQVIAALVDHYLSEWHANPSKVARIPMVLDQFALEISAWETIRTIVEKNISKLNQFGLLEGKGFKTLLKKYPKRDLVQRILELARQYLAKILEARENEEWRNLHIREWTQGVSLILKGLPENDMEHLAQKEFPIPDPPDVYVQVTCSLATEDCDKEIVQYFVPSSSEEDIIVALQQNVTQQKPITPGWGKAIGLMATMHPDWPWLNLIQTINQSTMNTAIPPEQWKEILQALWHLRTIEPQANTLLKQMTQNGRIFHYLYETSDKKDWETFSWNFIILLNYVDSDAPNIRTQNWGSSSQGFITFRNMLQTPEGHKEALSAFANLLRDPTAFAELLKVYDQRASTRKWIEKAIGEILERQPDFTQQIIQPGFSYSRSDLYLQVLKVIEPSSKEFKEFISFLKSNLKRMDKEQWLTILREGGNLLNLLNWFKKKSIDLELEQPLADALLKWIQILIQEKPDISSEKVLEYKIFIKAWKKNPVVETFWRNLRDRLIGYSEHDLSKVLELFGEELIRSEVLSDSSEKADEITRLLFPKVLERKTEPELRWIISILEKDPNFINNIKVSSLEDLANRFEQLKDLSEEIQQQVNNLLKQLQEHISKAKNEERKR